MTYWLVCAALTTRVYGLLKGRHRTGVRHKRRHRQEYRCGNASRTESWVKANICFEPQIVGALGGAMFARDMLAKQQKSSVKA